MPTQIITPDDERSTFRVICNFEPTPQQVQPAFEHEHDDDEDEEEQIRG